MKKNKIIFILIALIILLSIAAIIIGVTIKNKAGTSEDFYYCGGTICYKESKIAGMAISYGNCEVCGIKMEFSNTNVDKLCKNCSAKTKRCVYCGEQLTDEQISKNELKIAQFKKYQKIGASPNKIAYIDRTNEIAVLQNNNSIEDDKEYPNKIKIINMEDYSTKKEYKLKNDYIKGFSLDEEGRMFYDNGKLIVMGSEEEKSFIYNLEKESIVEQEYKIGYVNGHKYLYMKDLENNKKYYYIVLYDLLVNDLQEINWKTYFKPDTLKYIKSNDHYDAKIIYNDEEQFLISYYKEKYGSVTLELATHKGKKIDLSELKNYKTNGSYIVVSSRNMIVCYDVKNNKEIWSYDYKIKDNLDKEIF